MRLGRAIPEHFNQLPFLFTQLKCALSCLPSAKRGLNCLARFRLNVDVIVTSATAYTIRCWPRDKRTEFSEATGAGPGLSKYQVRDNLNLTTF
jgi:hypothetical protein